MKYKFLPHTADVKFQAFGKTQEKVFENSALALKEIIIGGVKAKIREKESKKIEARGKDSESLLNKFLGEILYLLDAEDFIIGKVKSIKITGDKLKAVIAGDKASNYRFINPVKAVTYNDIFVKYEKSKWVSQVVLDV